MSHVMLDLETMGNGPEAAIVAIGAVEFDCATSTLGREFYTPVDLESSVQLGAKMDVSTVLWWMQQSAEARAMFIVPSKNLAQVLLDFTYWIKELEFPADVKIWGNGATFDNVILTSAYRHAGLERPWSYKNDRCYRTVKALYPDVQVPNVGVAHNALDDAKYQAMNMLAMFPTN